MRTMNSEFTEKYLTLTLDSKYYIKIKKKDLELIPFYQNIDIRLFIYG